MPHQTIHPSRAIHPHLTHKVPPRFAGWVGTVYQGYIERIQALHPDLDIIGSFARVGELDLAALVLKAIDTMVQEGRVIGFPPGHDCRPPFSYEAKANSTTLDGQGETVTYHRTRIYFGKRKDIGWIRSWKELGNS